MMQEDDKNEIIEKQVFQSIGDCVATTGIAKEIIQQARKLGCPGFRGHRIMWHEAKEWIDKNINLLEDNIDTSLAELKKEEKKEDILLKKLKRKELEGQYLDPNEVRDFLIKMATIQSSTFKQLKEELKTKLVGRSLEDIESILDFQFNQFPEQLKKEFQKWITIQENS